LFAGKRFSQIKIIRYAVVRLTERGIVIMRITEILQFCYRHVKIVQNDGIGGRATPPMAYAL
jgi:hypothetical protein